MLASAAQGSSTPASDVGGSEGQDVGTCDYYKDGDFQTSRNCRLKMRLHINDQGSSSLFYNLLDVPREWKEGMDAFIEKRKPKFTGQ